MTPQEQRVAVAKACGWTITGNEESWGGNHPTGYHEQHLTCFIPDYPNDLNAMHNAEKMLKDGDQWIPYVNYIVPEHNHHQLYRIGTLVHATAAMRCKAFLKVFGKWTGE